MISVALWVVGFALFPPPEEAAFRKSVSALASSARTVWAAEFAKEGGFGVKYRAPTVLLFEGRTRTACGAVADAPFYCPADATVAIDRTFFAELDRLGGRRAECARAYVFAHLTGTHVLNETGHLKLVANARKTKRENEFVIRAELCASYLAGVWAHHAGGVLKNPTAEEAEDAIKTVLTIADDRLTRRSGGGAANPPWTHGTSRQRIRFFLEGVKTGDASKVRIDRFFTAGFDAKTGELADK